MSVIIMVAALFAALFAAAPLIDGCVDDDAFGALEETAFDEHEDLTR